MFGPNLFIIGPGRFIDEPPADDISELSKGILRAVRRYHFGAPQDTVAQLGGHTSITN